MIEIVHTYIKHFSLFTLASLIEKDEDFRLHLFIHEDDWDKNVVSWALANIENVKVYQSFWKGEEQARAMRYLKEYWKNKGGLNKRVMYAGGARIFLKNGWKNEIPDEKYFENKFCTYSHMNVYKDHPTYGKYYDILGFKSNMFEEEHVVRKETPVLDNIDTEFFIMNWDKMVAFDEKRLFARGQNARINPILYPHHVDRRVMGSWNRSFFTPFCYRGKQMPVYVNGKNDKLLTYEALNTKDFINHNVIMRKSFSVHVLPKWLLMKYQYLPAGIQLGIPWDLWTAQIPNIPVNLRNARINELLLFKSNKQKQVSRKLIEVGYKLGKI
jgi:hypothetical protein